MARTASKTAKILSELYEETFKNDSYEPFSITWPQLRSIAGVAKLDDYYLRKVNDSLKDSSYVLVPMDEILLVAMDNDLSRFRAIPERIVETFVYDADEDEDDEDLDLDDDDDPDLPDYEETGEEELAGDGESA